MSVGPGIILRIQILKDHVEGLGAQHLRFVGELVFCSGNDEGIDILDFSAQEFDIVFPVNDAVLIALHDCY